MIYRRASPEKDLQALVVRSFEAYFPKRHWLKKHHADEFTGAGQADLYGHVLGKFLAIELKVTPNRFEPAQVAQLRAVHESGGGAFGLLHDRREDGGYFLLPYAALAEFTLRHRTGWLPLPVMEVLKVPVLNVSAVPHLIGVKS